MVTVYINATKTQCHILMLALSRISSTLLIVPVHTVVYTQTVNKSQLCTEPASFMLLSCFCCLLVLLRIFQTVSLHYYCHWCTIFSSLLQRNLPVKITKNVLITCCAFVKYFPYTRIINSNPCRFVGIVYRLGTQWARGIGICRSGNG